MSGRWGIFVFLIGIVSLGTFCCLFFLGLPMYLKAGIAQGACLSKTTQCENNSETWDLWRNPWKNGDFHLHVYLYNITEPNDPTSYEVVGPYVYNVVKVRKDLDAKSETGDASELTYREQLTYTFNKNLSGSLDETDQLNVIDIPSLFLLKFLNLTEAYQRMPDYKNLAEQCELLNESLTNTLMLFRLWNFHGVEDLLTCNEVIAALEDCPNLVCRNVKVKEILFSGINRMSSRVSQKFSVAVLEKSRALGQTWLYQAWLEHVLPSDFDFSNGTFAFFRNNTTGELTRIDRGCENRENYGRVRQYKGRAELNMYNFHDSTEASNCGYCNKITGTDGILFAPFLNENYISDKWIQVFDSELCGTQELTRVIEAEAGAWRYFKNSRLVDYLDDTFVYTFDEILPSPNTSPCYCGTGNEMNMTMVGKMRQKLCCENNHSGIWPAKCKNGETMYFSKPYFLDVSESLRREFELDRYLGGQNTTEFYNTKMKTTTVFEIEPNTGIVVSSHKRIQLNVAFPWKSALSKGRTFELVPMMWYDKSYHLNARGLEHIQKKYFHLKTMVQTVQWICLGVVSTIVIFGIGLFLKKDKEEEDKEFKEFIKEMKKYNPLSGLSCFNRSSHAK